jgi:hypothetical protein
LQKTRLVRDASRMEQQERLTVSIRKAVRLLSLTQPAIHNYVRAKLLASVKVEIRIDFHLRFTTMFEPSCLPGERLRRSRSPVLG